MGFEGVHTGFFRGRSVWPEWAHNSSAIYQANFRERVL